MAASTRRDQTAPAKKPRKTRTASAEPNGEDEYITVPEVLKTLKIDRRTWQHWMTRGETPKNMIRLPNGRYRIPRADYQEWLAGLQVDA
ncbi:helix-turn-helix transcriptional regulator [[Actinomadura] parvosata]|uniref:helix-turn-helix transcriptional regulator n=1 Tax=[Actinomadura] parvosata TaxID=1955412 RepID=UPI00406C56F0